MSSDREIIFYKFKKVQFLGKNPQNTSCVLSKRITNCFRHTLQGYVWKVKYIESMGSASKSERRSLIQELGARNQRWKMSVQSAHFRPNVNYVSEQKVASYGS